MNYDDAGLIIATLEIDCPLCDLSYRNKFNLRRHLQSKHTDIDFYKYIEDKKLSKPS